MTIDVVYRDGRTLIESGMFNRPIDITMRRGWVLGTADGLLTGFLDGREWRVSLVESGDVTFANDSEDRWARYELDRMQVFTVGHHSIVNRFEPNLDFDALGPEQFLDLVADFIYRNAGIGPLIGKKAEWDTQILDWATDRARKA